MLPVRDDEHQKHFDHAQNIATICLSEKFLLLKNELDQLYVCSECDRKHSSLLAFQDALYTIIVEKEMDTILTQAIFGKG